MSGSAASLALLIERRARQLEELVRARLEVDVAGLHAGIKARLEAALALEPLPIDSELQDRRGPLGWGRVRTAAFRTPRLRKIVLTHVAAPPIIEGVGLVLLPETRLRAPIFAGDLMALPTRLSINADLYGAPADASQRRVALAGLQETFARLGSGPGPGFASAIGSGAGLHAKVSPRLVDDGIAALTAALGRALEELSAAAEGPDTAEAQRRFFSVFHEHGPRRGPLGRMMGADWAERYSHLLFE